MTEDELERALFALPLATPPAGLRDRILALTLEAEREPAPVRSLVFNSIDMVGIGVILAIATWLLVSGSSHVFVDAARPAYALFERAGGETTMLVWISIGAAVAAIATFASRFERPLHRS